MRILHIINDLDTGGAQKLVADLAVLQSERNNVHLEVATLFGAKDGVFKNWLESHTAIPVRSLNLRNPFMPSAIMKIRSIIKDFDIVHAHLFPTGYLCVLANTGLGKKLIYTEHSTTNRRRDHKILRPLEKTVYSKFDAIGCISDATRQNLLNWLGEKMADKTLVIHNGVDLSGFRLPEPCNQHEIFGRVGKPVLMVSRFSKSKDHAAAVKSLSHISDPDVFMAFAGDGECMEDIKMLAEECGVRSRCVFLGTRTDIPRLIGASLIGLQSSRWEGFGLTALEMMAGGLPVVASDIEGLREVVGDAGLLFSPGDPIELADRINALTSDSQLKSEVIAKCRKRSETFDIRNTADNYLNLYRSLSGA